MIERVKYLWAGDVPLGRAFWDYAIFYGLLLNFITHFLFFVLLLNDAHMALVGLAFALPIPYNVLVTVAVWRSAGRYEGPKKWAEWARVGILVWLVVLTAA
jgi:hypothetical protein